MSYGKRGGGKGGDVDQGMGGRITAVLKDTVLLHQDETPNAALKAAMGPQRCAKSHTRVDWPQTERNRNGTDWAQLCVHLPCNTPPTKTFNCVVNHPNKIFNSEIRSLYLSKTNCF